MKCMSKEGCHNSLQMKSRNFKGFTEKVSSYHFKIVFIIVKWEALYIFNSIKQNNKYPCTFFLIHVCIYLQTLLLSCANCLISFKIQSIPFQTPQIRVYLLSTCHVCKLRLVPYPKTIIHNIIKGTISLNELIYVEKRQHLNIFPYLKRTRNIQVLFRSLNSLFLIPFAINVSHYARRKNAKYSLISIVCWIVHDMVLSR